MRLKLSDERLALVGAHLALREFTEHRDHQTPFELSSLESYVRAVWPEVVVFAQLYEVFRVSPDTAALMDRTKHEAIYSSYSYRLSLYDGLRSVGRLYNGPDDRARVKDIRNKRRRFLESRMTTKLKSLLDGRCSVLDQLEELQNFNGECRSATGTGLANFLISARRDLMPLASKLLECAPLKAALQIRTVG